MSRKTRFARKVGGQYVRVRFWVETRNQDGTWWRMQAIVHRDRLVANAWDRGEEKGQEAELKSTGRGDLAALMAVKDIALAFLATLKRGQYLAVDGADDRRTSAYRALVRYGFTSGTWYLDDEGHRCYWKEGGT